MSSSQPTASVPASDRTLSSIKLEILLTLWRIGEALKQVDGEATKLKIRRWEHGIAREVWNIVPALGLCSLISLGRDVGDHSTYDSIATLDALKILMRACSIQARAIEVNLANLDVPAFLKSLRVSAEDFGGLAENVGHPRWWEWDRDEFTIERISSWWFNPERPVMQPMPVFAEALKEISKGY